MKEIKPSESSQYSLSEDEIRRIINATEELRDKLIIELLAFTGCRRGELVLLRVSDIDLERNRITIPTLKQEKGITKGQAENVARKNAKVIPIINEDLRNTLKIYLKEKKVILTPMSYLIQGRQGNGSRRPLSKQRINQIVAECANRAGVKSPNPKRKNVHPHLFRHTLVRYCQKREINPKLIQKLLRHSSIKTTLDMYGEPSFDDMKDGLEKMKGFTSGGEI